jgi:hypothetical protein
MLRTNLSTRPFYNERGVHAGLGAVAVAVMVLTIFNLSQIVVLTRRQSDLSSRAAAAENRARDLRAHADAMRQRVDPRELESVSGSAREANLLIGRRLFSWTDLLNRLETTLPDEVRITALLPVIDKEGKIFVDMTVVGRRVEDIDRFMENLDRTGVFTDVFSRNESSTNDGLRQTSIEARYLPK